MELPYYEGDRVSAGEVLARQDDSLLEAQFQKAQAQRRQAEADLRRLDQLQGRKLVSEDEQARAATAVEVASAEEKLLHTRLAHTRLHAPFAGVISARLAEPGDVLPTFSHILTLTDPSSLVTEVKVSELLLPTLVVGDTAQVRIDALGSRDFEGRISRIFPTIDADTRQGTLEVVLEPAPAGARPGQFCRVKLQGRPVPRLSIPFAGLRRDLQGEFVYRLADGGTAQRRAVITGLNLGDRIEVLEGLEAGMRVVVQGFLGLSDGMAVQITGGDAASHD